MVTGDYMLYSTHIKIAKLALETLTETEIDHISRSQFIKGSIHPDFDLYYRGIKHQFGESISVVNALLHEVMEQSMSRYTRGFKMGIIAHFLADYMCSYHSNPHFSRRNFATHLIYEQRLHSLTKGLTGLDFDLFQSKTAGDLLVEVADFITDHMQAKSISMIDDFKNASSLIHHFVKIVLNHVVKNQASTPYLEAPMRVAIFTDTYYPQINGVSNTIFHYIQYLEEQQIPYVIISPLYQQKLIDKEQGYQIVRVRSVSFLLYKEAKIALPKRKEMKRLIDEFKPTVIHAMTEFTIGLTGVRYGRQHKIPVVSNYSTHFADHLKHFKLGWFIRPIKRYLSWFHRQASMTTCPSHHADQYLTSLGIKKTYIFGRGIQHDAFSPTFRDNRWRKQFGDQPFIYLYVGRISVEKELHLALEAFQRIKKREHRVVFVIVGDGPKKTIYEKQYPDVHFTGYLTGKALSMAYASSDVFVFPSSTETFGNVVLEAMASALPVIVANEGGVLENVKNMHNGMIANQQDVESYERLMLLYYVNRQHHQAMKNQALSDIKDKHWHKIFHHQLLLYRDLISASGG